MLDLGSVLIVIPARGGSKRLPRKNVLPLAGKPLIAWTIEAAVEARLVGGVRARIMVTSDDEEILSISREYESKGVISYKRSSALATDSATTVDVLIDAVNAERKLKFPVDTIILLQPTSPLRNSNDILAALNIYRKAGCNDTVVSVCQVDHPTAWTGTLTDELVLCGIDFFGGRSQDYQMEYRLNGAVYISQCRNLMDRRTLFSECVRSLIMPKSRSFDIDDKDDFELCAYIMSKAINKAGLYACN